MCACPWRVRAKRLDVELNIWRLKLRTRLQESGSKTGRHRHWPRSLQCIFQRNLYILKGVPGFAVDRASIGLEYGARLQVILQIFSHTRKILHNLNAMLAQFLAGPDARQHQDVRRPKRTSRQDHLTACPRFYQPRALANTDTDAAPPLHDQTFGLGARENMEV